MYDITLRRIIFTSAADITLKMMKARTGLTPNILCRLALALSLDEPGVPRLVEGEERSQREINRYTLLGEYETAFISLVKARLHSDGLDTEAANEYFVAHVHRGVSLLPNRVKTIADIGSLVA